MFTVEELGGFDKIKEGDQDIVKSKSAHSPQAGYNTKTTTTTTTSINTEITSSTTTSSPQSTTIPSALALTASTSASPFEIGARVMAKVQVCFHITIDFVLYHLASCADSLHLTVQPCW